MKYAYSFAIACLLTFNMDAQTASDSVKAVVNQLFTAMRTPDAEMLRSIFAEQAILQSVSGQGDSVVMGTRRAEQFADMIAALGAGAADERMTISSVQVDGPLAVVSGPYKFYRSGKFSHCGVDNLQLVRLGGQWKIIYLSYTMRKEPCD